MALFLNISGSLLLLLAGAAVLIKILHETGLIKITKITASANENEYKKSGIKTLSLIFASAILSRWLIFFICFVQNGGDMSFMDYIRSVFEKAGDTPHYLFLAENGYVSSGDKANLIVFYPLYPWLMRLFNLAVHDYFISGLVVSDFCFGAASCFLFELLNMEYGRMSAIWGTILLFCAPFGLFYGAVYTESLFIMLTLMTFYYIRTKKYIPAAIFGFLSCLSRTQGVILFICAFYLLIAELIKTKKFNTHLAICTFTIPLGFIVYLLMNSVLFGNCFKYLEFQSAAPWYNTAHWFGKTLSQSYNMAKEHEGLANIIYYPQLIFFFVGTGTIFYGIYRGVRSEYLIYCGAYIFMCYTHGWLISGSRYMCACIPLYIIFAACKNKYIKTAIIIICAVLFFMVTRLWTMGYAIM